MSKGKKSVITKGSIEDALGAAAEIDELRDEMSSWRDALEDKLSHTSKYESVSEAADTLENADLGSRVDMLLDVARVLGEGCFENLLEQEVSWHETRAYKGRSLSRADRLGNATSALRAACGAMTAAVQEKVASGEVSEDDDRVSTVLEALGEVEEGLDEVEGVEFPGMYG